MSDISKTPKAPLKFEYFQKLTPQEQQDFWDKNWPPQKAPSADIASGDNPCCKLRDSLIGQLRDEEDGMAYYIGIAGKLGELGETIIADTVNSIADTEFEHYLMVRGVIDVLTENCGCKRKTIGPPFGNV